MLNKSMDDLVDVAREQDVRRLLYSGGVVCAWERRCDLTDDAKFGGGGGKDK